MGGVGEISNVGQGEKWMSTKSLKVFQKELKHRFTSFELKVSFHEMQDSADLKRW